MIRIKISAQGFLGLPIMYPLSDCYNFRWWIQDSDRKHEKKHDNIGKTM